MKEVELNSLIKKTFTSYYIQGTITIVVGYKTITFNNNKQTRVTQYIL